MIQPIHHSLADWDKSSTDFMLSTARYTSSPTSLMSTVMEGPYFLCNHPSTLCIPEGRILCQTYLGADVSELGVFSFRNQCPTDHVPDFQNCYMLWCEATGILVYEVVNGHRTWHHNYGPRFPRDKWVQIELTWWNYPLYDDKHPLAIQLRAYYDGSWHDRGRAEREDARWHDSPINRVGLRPWRELNYFDDTEIHAPVWPPPGVKMIYTSIVSYVFPSDPSMAWVEWDLSDIIPAEATVVEVHITAIQNNIAGCRPLGSDLLRIFYVGTPPFAISYTLHVEVGAERKIETMRWAFDAVEFRIIGYWIPQ